MHSAQQQWGEQGLRLKIACQLEELPYTCRMRGMIPTVEMVTLERLRPNSAGLIIVRVAVRTCS